jgi:hypothetical protein
MNQRTSFITAAAITGVVLAGTTAVAANIGILNAADSDNVGDLSAVAVTTPVDATTAAVAPQIVDIYLDESTSTTTSDLTVEGSTPATTSSTASQDFAVVDAGIVTVEQDGDAVRLIGIDANDGWTWISDESSPELTVTFTDAESEYVFYASVGPDGQIAARVDEQITNIVEVPAPQPTPPGHDSQTNSRQGVDDHDDHDEGQNEGGEDDEHEGGGDDD